MSLRSCGLRLLLGWRPEIRRAAAALSNQSSVLLNAAALFDVRRGIVLGVRRLAFSLPVVKRA
jgi:hypothetical protein